MSCWTPTGCPNPDGLRGGSRLAPTGFVRGNDRLTRRLAEDPGTAARVGAIVDGWTQKTAAADERDDRAPRR